MIPELGHLAMILALCLCLVQATLPLMLARVLTAIEEAAPEITRQVLADVALAALSSTERG